LKLPEIVNTADEVSTPKKLDCNVITRGIDGVEVSRKVPHYYQWFWRGKEMTELRRCTTCNRLYNMQEKEADEDGVLKN